MLPQVTAQRTVEVLGHIAQTVTWQRALDRAHDSGIKVYHIDGKWLTSSVSNPHRFHYVNGVCDCQGAAHGFVCQHLVAVLAARALRGELGQCAECGRVLSLLEMESEPRHVGGQEDRLEFYCGKGHGHQAGR